ncbi:hypothetical protein [Natronorubrum tibetense]|uniref:Uncharacterized protein n=1 Tax=Natronorubrum tibetense GA33 TaxID=1114856 RepID=L9VPB6_9EURY|nr:hypothetical protein [Natronorubrum tibetense]ELY38906.1 hypothetical protein C496_15982 [Natronorubrum tibetense GA33]
MSTAVDITQQYSFPSPIDVTAVLERLGIQFLDVNERRAIVIFDRAILNLEARNGRLTALERVAITVYDIPLDDDREIESESEAAIELVEDFREQLSSTVGTSTENLA